jgi:hypothetical protein
VVLAQLHAAREDVERDILREVVRGQIHRLLDAKGAVTHAAYEPESWFEVPGGLLWDRHQLLLLPVKAVPVPTCLCGDNYC